MTSLRYALSILLSLGLLAALSAPHASAADAADFWTKERMRDAAPADALSLPGDHAGSQGGPPAGDEQGAASFVPPAEPGQAPRTRLRPGMPAGAGQDGPGAVEFLAGVVRELVPDPTAETIRTHGKVFFTARAQSGEQKMYVCSGTVVTSKVQSLVLTAGHCVFDANHTDRFLDNWVFVPAYSKDRRPFGVWPAKSLATTKEWRRDGNLRYDLGAAVVRRAEGKSIQQVVGSRGIAFNQPRKQRYQAFGYPHTDAAGGEFDGTKEYVCASGMTRRDSPIPGPGPRTTQIRCDMTAGSSGGSWVVDGVVQSVTSYGYESDAVHLYGPYLASTAETFYKAVRGGIGKKAKRKISAAKARSRS